MAKPNEYLYKAIVALADSENPDYDYEDCSLGAAQAIAAAAIVVAQELKRFNDRAENEAVSASSPDWKAIAQAELERHGARSAEEARRLNESAKEAIAAAVDKARL